MIAWVSFIRYLLNLSIADRISTLAFIAMCKKAYTSSVLFMGPAYKLAKKIGMSDGRMFNKYLEYARQLELIKVQEDRIIILKWTKAVARTLNIHPIAAKFFDKPYSGVTKFKEYQYHIEKVIIGLNFKRQEHHIRVKFPSDKIQTGQFKTWYTTQLLKIANNAKKASDLGIKYQANHVLKMNKTRIGKLPANNNQDKRNIVTGSIHSGKLIGRSHSTGNRRLRSWIANGVIKIENVIRYKDCIITDRAIEIMNLDRRSGGLLLPTNTGYKIVYGKKVVFFKLGLYKYGIRGSCSS